MSGLKGLAKGGWHSKGKDGSLKESWRGDFKGVDQVAGWMGRKKDPTDQAKDHISRPLHALKDPAAFGPPPKNVNYHGGAALPNQITPDTRGLGAPLSREEIQAKQQAEEEVAQREAEEAAKPKGPPVPFRSDTTGLSTAHLPPPPGRRDGADGRSPASSPAQGPAPSPGGKPKPNLPPSLPPRQNSNSATSLMLPPYSASAAEPESHRGILNQGSMNRLSAAGVSVPGFGIRSKGKQTLPPPSLPSTSRSSAPTQSSANGSQINEFQSRFSRLAPSSPKSEALSEGTTFAQKQAALKTASSFRNDPNSVSLSDAKTAAGTAINFRERHGDQVKSGWQSASKLNTKYGISDKVGAYGGAGKPQSPEHASPQIDVQDSTHAAPELGVSEKKKPPPPPPLKRANLAGTSVRKEVGPPPPIPMSSKPNPLVSGSQ